MGDPDTLWLNAMNVLLGAGVLVFCTVIAIQAAREWLSRHRPLRRKPL